ncbi:MAG: long-chain fatty acid--CoA ligase [Bacilli bacterium]|nr:long-chain fatty acid--CoA ligase [Bacilli bacterium]
MINNLKISDAKLHDLYLRNIAIGNIQGPMTGKASIDKEWLKYYSEEQILGEMPEKTIFEYMKADNENHLNDIALKYFNTKITYKQFFCKIEECEKAFIANGIKEGDIVTICMPNTPEAVIAFYALNKLGAIANMIHPLSGQNEIKNFINEVNSKIIITIDIACNKILNVADDTKLEKIVNVTPVNSMGFIVKKIYKYTKKAVKIPNDERLISWDEFIKMGRNLENISDNEIKYAKDKLAILLHTGGTTGNPKGVMLTNDNFNSMVEQFFKGENNFERGDSILAIMPVFHGFGLCSSIHLPLSVGVHPILIPKLNGKKLDKVFKKYKPNNIIGVPTLFKGMLTNKKLKNMDMSYLKYVVSGGDLVKDSLEEDINTFLRQHGSKAKLSKGYGLSEAVAGVTFASKDYNLPSSIGIPMTDTNIKIVKPGTNDELFKGEIGEMCIKSPSVMKGYYNNNEETNKTMQDGWLHTGDLGYCENGIFYFAQRKGNMIISSGVNVYPSNIEQVIEMHEAVASCAVIGIYHSYKIQVPKAYIVLKEGYEASEELKNEIASLCRKNLNIYSIPYSYEFREKLPQTLLGKISHKELTEERQKVKVYKR